MTLADAAIALGVPVFPCDDQKRPIVARGFKAATRDPSTIRAQFTASAKLIGMPTGAASGLFAVDIDIKPNQSGQWWLDENGDALPPTRRHRTRSGGVHLLFLSPPDSPIRNSAGLLGPCVDVRGDGGYIIVPPSAGYAIMDDAPPAEPPRWLVSAARLRRVVIEPERIAYGTGPATERVLNRLLRAAAKVSGASQGNRNDTLNRESFMLGVLVAAGWLPRDTVYGELYHAAKAAGLADIEIRATLRSALSAALAAPRR